MKKNKAEKILAEAVKTTIPDVFDSILSRCESKGGKIMDQNENYTNNSKSKKSWIKKAVAAAAAVALIVGCSLGFGSYQKAHAAETIVSVDAGGAVSVGVNDEDVVVSVGDNAANVKKSDVKGKKISSAASTIINKMIQNGTISQDNNVILVSVQDVAAEAHEEFEDEVTDEVNEELYDAKEEVGEEFADAIEEVLDEHGIDVTVIVQRFVEDEVVEEIAREFSISSGKASFIQKVISSNENEDGIQFSDLADKSINDIVEYAAKWLSSVGVSINADDDVSITIGQGNEAGEKGGTGGKAEGSAGRDLNVSVGTDANVDINSGADGSFETHIDADDGDVKVDLKTGADYSLGIEVDGEKFTYDSSDPGGSMVGIIDSIIKAS